LRMERDLLRRELEAAHAREQAAIAREQEERHASREREALLLRMVEQMQHRYDRLLDTPRSTPPPSPQDAPGAPHGRTRPQSTPVREDPPQRQRATVQRDPRGEMRRRIVALLQDYPAGLTPAEMRPLLGVDKSLADTCLGMLRYGLVQRVGPGRYVVADARP
jgi:hypothetical protein